MAEGYDLLALGSGEAGKYLAWTLASQGKKVAVIERRYVGGSGDRREHRHDHGARSQPDPMRSCT